MVDQTTERTIIAATPGDCYNAAIDFERYPEWATDVKMARILSRDEDGRAVDVEFRAAAMGRSTTYTLRYFYGSNPSRLAWRLQTGDIKRMGGALAGEIAPSRQDCIVKVKRILPQHGGRSRRVRIEGIAQVFGQGGFPAGWRAGNGNDLTCGR